MITRVEINENLLMIRKSSRQSKSSTFYFKQNVFHIQMISSLNNPYEWRGIKIYAVSDEN